MERAAPGRLCNGLPGMLEGCPWKGLRIAGYIEKMPLCPMGGIYSYMGEQVPVLGDLYMKCSLADEGHSPADATAW